MINPKERITVVQTAITVASTIIGVGIVTLPRTLAEAMKTPDGWIAVLIGGLIAMAVGYIVIRLSQRFPGKTFYQYSSEVVGKFLGWGLGLLLVLYFTMLAGFEARMLSEMVRTYLLDKTPHAVVTLSFIWVGIYLVTGGMNPLVRLMELYFPMTILLFFFIISMGFQKFELDNLRPVLGKGVMPLIEGVKTTALSYTGFEIMLILTAFMEESQKALKAVWAGIGIPIFLYLMIIVVVIGVLTVEEARTLVWPVGTMAVEVQVIGGVIESSEVLFIVLWILIIYTTFVVAYYLAGLGLSQLFQKDIQPFLYGLLPVIYIVSMVPRDLNGAFRLGDLVGYFGIGIGGIIPLILLVIASIRRVGHGKK